MGNCSNNSLIYSELISVSNNANKETGVYRHPQFVKNLLQGFLNSDGERVNTVKDAWESVVKNKGQNKCLGSRKEKGESGEYVSKSFSEIDKIVREIGSGIIKMGLSEIEGEYKMIAIYGKNSEEWMISDMAGQMFGVSTVAIYDTLGHESINYIMNQTQIKTIFTSVAMIDSILKQDKLKTVQFIVYFQNQNLITDQQQQALVKKGYKTIGLDELRQLGAMNLMEYPMVNSDDLSTISYTSGTTGDPKGVMLTQSNILSTLGSLQCYDFQFLSTDVHLSYLPLAHIFERLITYFIMLVGGYIGYFNGDVLKLKQDMQDLQPTIFASVPRLYNRFYDIIKQQFSNLEGISSYIIEKGVQTKLTNFKQNAVVKHSFYDNIAFHKTKSIFGGKVRVMITGSAPIQSEVIDFLKICACCQILEGYGQTESTGGSFVTMTQDSEGNHVGGPVPAVEFKIQSVQEMDYLVTDSDEKQQPTPRGELLIRGYGVFKGYYKQNDKTIEALDDQGWLYTGDIVRLNYNGSISIIDRKKNIFKLAQGEYVAAEKIEMLYRMLPYIEECFIYGDSLQAFLVVIIFPNLQELLKLAKNSNIVLQSEDIKDLQENKQLKDLLLKLLSEKGKQMKLNGIEIPKKLHLIPKPFIDYDCITTSFKLKRHNAKKVFQKEITQMYQS